MPADCGWWKTPSKLVTLPLNWWSLKEALSVCCSVVTMLPYLVTSPYLYKNISSLSLSQTSNISSPILTLNVWPSFLLHWENRSNQKRPFTNMHSPAHLPSRLHPYPQTAFSPVTMGKLCMRLSQPTSHCALAPIPSHVLINSAPERPSLFLLLDRFFPSTKSIFPISIQTCCNVSDSK